MTETVPLEFTDNIYDFDLPAEVKQQFEKVEKFKKAFYLDDITTCKCGGKFKYLGTQDRAADEGMNIRFICDKCGSTKR